MGKYGVDGDYGGDERLLVLEIEDGIAVDDLAGSKQQDGDDGYQDAQADSKEQQRVERDAVGKELQPLSGDDPGQDEAEKDGGHRKPQHVGDEHTADVAARGTVDFADGYLLTATVHLVGGVADETHQGDDERRDTGDERALTEAIGAAILVDDEVGVRYYFHVAVGQQLFQLLTGPVEVIGREVGELRKDS